MMCQSGVLQIIFKLVFYSDFLGTSSGLIPFLTQRKRSGYTSVYPLPFLWTRIYGLSPSALPYCYFHFNKPFKSGKTESGSNPSCSVGRFFRLIQAV